ncbi:MAG: DUF3137 domain-containing protein [Robiginitomaculum sp.]|nr:DUF3137 domain-containing protein [Robiginitomaculum sp.]
MTDQNTTFETRAEFKGFDKFYKKTIHPYLVDKEQDRITRVAKGKKYGAITAGLIITVALVLALRFGIFLVSLFVGAVGILAGWGVSYAMLTKLKGETKQFLMGNICEFLGWDFQVDKFDPPNLSLYKTNKLLPSWDRVNFEDRMSGTVDGVEFTFCEAHLERESRDSDGDTTWTTVFRGILMEVGFHRDFLGRTVVLRDAGIFNFKKKAGMKKVGLASPKFEKIFEAYSTDQVESRYLLTPVFMQKLVDLETSVSGKKIRFGFLEDKLHIAVEAPNQFEAGSMYKPLTDTERTHKIMGEISAVIDVIKGVGEDKRRKR